jgi:hypothetical protein
LDEVPNGSKRLHPSKKYHKGIDPLQDIIVIEQERGQTEKLALIHD